LTDGDSVAGDDVATDEIASPPTSPPAGKSESSPTRSSLNPNAAPFVPGQALTPTSAAKTGGVSTAQAKSRAKREKAKAKYQKLKEAQDLESQMSHQKHGGEKYKAIKGDKIDEAVQKVVNDAENKFYNYIRIRRAKKLGKVASAKRSKREKDGGGMYRIGSAHKIHVRLMQEMLFVRQGNQWIDFSVFVHDQIESDNRAHARVAATDPPKGMVWVPKQKDGASASGSATGGN